MAGVIAQWDRDQIAHEGWTRLALRPADRAAGRAVLARFGGWFVEQGRGHAMVRSDVFDYEITIAFSDITDCVLFRLSFVDVPLGVVPQPHAHFGFDIHR